MLVWAIRLSFLAALVLGLGMPIVALAAPTPTPAPQRAPNVFGSPSATPTPDRQAAVALPSPSAPAATSMPSPSGTPAPAPSVEPTPDGDQQTIAGDIEAAVDWRAFVPTDVADHLATMDRAARASGCGVPWQLLAAIARVESDFGRNMATSSAGAIGYGQFLPSSWNAFGSDGNAYDYHDALPAIALYLCQAGLERDPRAALFAYNHADWYVDLVLNLAVRYDRMAPGAPIPDVLSVGPAQQQPMSMDYAVGRDLRQQTRARTVTSAVRWLGVPWLGRTAGQSIDAGALQATSLRMLRAGFGVKGDAPLPQTLATSENLAALRDAAWQSGLLAKPGEAQQWTVSELRRNVQRGEPVLVFVGRRGLPGHPQDEADGEQPLLVIGITPSGFVYSDPSFSSSLGYGLDMSEADLLKFWEAAAQPRQALAFAPKPRVPSGHLAQADAPAPITRIELPATPVPRVAPEVLPTTEPTATEVGVATFPLESPSPKEARVQSSVDASVFLPVAFGILVVAAAVVALRRRRARPSP